MPEDFPLPIASDLQEPAADPWNVQQQPTTLIALWPESIAPTQMEILSALEQATGGPPQLVQEMSNDEVLWNGVFLTGLGETPIIIWAERAKPLSREEIDDPAVHACKWAIGLETMLPTASPLEHYGNLLRVLAVITDAPAILDTVTWRYWRKRELDDLTVQPPSELPTDALWTIHAVNDPGAKRTANVWLHTHGLLRCGLPELEMLEVPQPRMSSAANLMNIVADFVIDQGAPQPGEVFEIGQDLALTLHAWRTIAPDLPAGEMGGLRDRQGDDNPHAEVSAVICGPEQRGSFRRLWSWPDEAAAQIEKDDAVLFRSASSTQRRAALAQQHWSELATAHASISRRAASSAQPPIVLIKAGLSVDDDGDHHEHLWFRIRSFEGDRASGELLNQPNAIARLRAGDIVSVQREWLSDWALLSSSGRFGPGDVPAMWRAIHAMNAHEHFEHAQRTGDGGSEAQ